MPSCYSAAGQCVGKIKYIKYIAEHTRLSWWYTTQDSDDGLFVFQVLYILLFLPLLYSFASIFLHLLGTGGDKRACRGRLLRSSGRRRGCIAVVADFSVLRYVSSRIMNGHGREDMAFRRARAGDS